MIILVTLAPAQAKCVAEASQVQAAAATSPRRACAARQPGQGLYRCPRSSSGQLCGMYTLTGHAAGTDTRSGLTGVAKVPATTSFQNRAPLQARQTVAFGAPLPPALCGHGAPINSLYVQPEQPFSVPPCRPCDRSSGQKQLALCRPAGCPGGQQLHPPHVGHTFQSVSPCAGQGDNQAGSTPLLPAFCRFASSQKSPGSMPLMQREASGQMRSPSNCPLPRCRPCSKCAWTVSRPLS